MYRIGEGYDVHRLVEGRELILGGVKVPYEKGLLGHSDADVLTHAIIDAVLGACALGDVGKHFPDTDSRYKDANSLELLNSTMEIVMSANNTYRNEYNESVVKICNIDSTIICQAPKLSPYIDEMRKNIARTLYLDINQVSIKATTEEGLGFTGAGYGIAAKAIVMIEL